MRRILVEFKRGGEVQKVPLAEAAVLSPQPGEDLHALDGALSALAQIDSRKAKVVELRFFGGMAEEETAVAMGISSDPIRSGPISPFLGLYDPKHVLTI